MFFRRQDVGRYMSANSNCIAGQGHDMTDFDIASLYVDCHFKCKVSNVSPILKTFNRTGKSLMYEIKSSTFNWLQFELKQAQFETFKTMHLKLMLYTSAKAVLVF